MAESPSVRGNGDRHVGERILRRCGKVGAFVAAAMRGEFLYAILRLPENWLCGEWRRSDCTYLRRAFENSCCLSMISMLVREPMMSPIIAPIIMNNEPLLREIVRRTPRTIVDSGGSVLFPKNTRQRLGRRRCPFTRHRRMLASSSRNLRRRDIILEFQCICTVLQPLMPQLRQPDPPA